MRPPKLKHFCDLIVKLGPIRELGQGRAGTRRIIPIIGGSVKGPKVNGTILNLGADWQTIFHDDVAELDTRYAFETDDGALIEVINYGFRHGPAEVIKGLSQGKEYAPDEYYMRTIARLESGDEKYSWINKMLFVGTGSRHPNSVHISLYTVQ